ncbi:hypothetical protein [Niabella drilacis]|uniref:Tetratricopeptide repeat-containing protein n=1 Tax=Niabella drilacis (strain DSM 25811 / CCM 8410 / CCUG 62505 / LMG 26954 / E90) TaxID=1285928 RepID=A0A1G6T3F0_NIADE|nr:hypothetical protein [Niabella drilacis]SDD23549.1 hypothetical protein SAMN04487894_10779 [Niabella drilacis]
MNWKASITACVSCLFLMVPNNIFSCADVEDAYSSFTSFFNRYAAETPNYAPFYFADLQFLRDDSERPATAEAVVKEWCAFTGDRVTQKEAHAFVMQFDRKDLSALYYHIEEGKPLTLPDSVKNNGMTRFFLEHKDLEALGYLMYAKQVEPYVTREYNSWDATPRDSIKMNGLLKNGVQLFKAAKTPLFQLKYGYQVVRLAHYNHQYTDAIRYYDELVSKNPTTGVLQSLSLGLKAGALYQLGRRPEAAYIFSQIFNATDIKKIANFNSFAWAVPDEARFRKTYLSLCKNSKEKAGMLALYSLNNDAPDIAVLSEIHQLNPGMEIMPALVVREINKVEMAFLQPFGMSNAAVQQKGIRATLGSFSPKETEELEAFVKTLEDIAGDRKYREHALYPIGAAYISCMLKDYKNANRLLAAAKKIKRSPQLEDQWMLTSLLVSINENARLDAAAEQKVLSSLQWLWKKAEQEKQQAETGLEQYQWRNFFKNVMVDVIAARYAAQGQTNRMVLAYGAADKALWVYPDAINYVRDSFSIPQAEALYGFLTGEKFTPFESFLLKINTLNRKGVADYIGTAYLREYNYDKAIGWLGKEERTLIEKDPFKELLYDQEERLPGDGVTTTKLAYAKTMKSLLAQPGDAQALYKLGLGYYNITYYGYAWELATFYRSGADGYVVPPQATAFEKDYYGCYRAKDCFEKALKMATDPELKAKCLFMMAKCSQKELRKPQYGDFNYNYDLYDQKLKAYYREFKKNPLFVQYQKEYADTRFYKETLTRCSYLKDFVNKN